MASDRAVRFFGDILPPKSFEKRVIRKREIDEVTKILAMECGIYGKHLTIRGEGRVTE